MLITEVRLLTNTLNGMNNNTFLIRLYLSNDNTNLCSKLVFKSIVINNNAVDKVKIINKLFDR